MRRFDLMAEQKAELVGSLCSLSGEVLADLKSNNGEFVLDSITVVFSVNKIGGLNLSISTETNQQAGKTTGSAYVQRK